MAAYKFEQHGVGVGRGRGVGRLHQAIVCDLRHRHELSGLGGWHRAVQGIGHGQGTHQNQHDQPHAFLPIVGAVGKRYAAAGQNQQAPDPDRGRVLAGGRAVQFRPFDQYAHDDQQQGRRPETYQWREQQCIADLGDLVPVHPFGARPAVDQGAADTHAQDRTDQRV